jgi:hypothetical protein
MSTMRRETLDPKSHLYYAPRWVQERVDGNEADNEADNEAELEPELRETPERLSIERLPRHKSPPLDDRLPNGIRRLFEFETNFESMADVRQVARRSLLFAIAACAVSATGIAAVFFMIAPMRSLERDQSILAADAGKLPISARPDGTTLVTTTPPQAAPPLPLKDTGAAANPVPTLDKTAMIKPVAAKVPSTGVAKVKAVPAADLAKTKEGPAAEVAKFKVASAAEAPKSKVVPATDAPKARAAPAPAARVSDPAQVAALMKRADALIASGDLPAARLILQWVAETHNAHAAFELGMTYDPAFIKRLGAVSVVPDSARARTWYRQAQAWGSAEASKRLQALAADDTGARRGN